VIWRRFRLVSLRFVLEQSTKLVSTDSKRAVTDPGEVRDPRNDNEIDEDDVDGEELETGGTLNEGGEGGSLDGTGGDGGGGEVEVDGEKDGKSTAEMCGDPKPCRRRDVRERMGGRERRLGEERVEEKGKKRTCTAKEPQVDRRIRTAMRLVEALLPLVRLPHPSERIRLVVLGFLPSDVSSCSKEVACRNSISTGRETSRKCD
jgi:hypothetical protein